MFIDTDIEECRVRDPKGLYKRADAGLIPNFTGVSSPYERPEDPEVLIKTEQTSVEAAIDAIVERLRASGLLPSRAV